MSPGWGKTTPSPEPLVYIREDKERFCVSFRLLETSGFWSHSKSAKNLQLLLHLPSQAFCPLLTPHQPPWPARCSSRAPSMLPRWGVRSHLCWEGPSHCPPPQDPPLPHLFRPSSHVTYLETLCPDRSPRGVPTPVTL